MKKVTLVDSFNQLARSAKVDQLFNCNSCNNLKEASYFNYKEFTCDGCHLNPFTRCKGCNKRVRSTEFYKADNKCVFCFDYKAEIEKAGMTYDEYIEMENWYEANSPAPEQMGANLSSAD